MSDKTVEGFTSRIDGGSDNKTPNRIVLKKSKVVFKDKLTDSNYASAITKGMQL